MRKLVVIALVGLAPLLGTTPAGAAGTPHSNAVCVAAFVTSQAGPGFGEMVSGFAKELRPFGHLVGEEASTDTCIAD